MIEPTSLSSTENYMSLYMDGYADRRQDPIDSGVTGDTEDPFEDECVRMYDSFVAGSSYYFHAKIKRMTSAQKFYIYLVNYENADEEEVKTQYLKTIEVQAGDPLEWVDFETVFTPLLSFDCILFKLQRTINDYRVETRYPSIVYEELSLIHNIIETKIQNGLNFVKMGVQARPGLTMCINNEEIHVGRSGIYEVRNGAVLVDFFSVVTAAQEDINGSNPLRGASREPVTLEEYLKELAEEIEKDPSSVANGSSVCIFENSKLRGMDAFTLDYMYKEEE